MGGSRARRLAECHGCPAEPALAPGDRRRRDGRRRRHRGPGGGHGGTGRAGNGGPVPPGAVRLRAGRSLRENRLDARHGKTAPWAVRRGCHSPGDPGPGCLRGSGGRASSPRSAAPLRPWSAGSAGSSAPRPCRRCCAPGCAVRGGGPHPTAALLGVRRGVPFRTPGAGRQPDGRRDHLARPHGPRQGAVDGDQDKPGADLRIRFRSPCPRPWPVKRRPRSTCSMSGSGRSAP